MGQFRIEMNQEGEVAVDYRLPGEHARFVVEPQVEIAVAMQQLELHFAKELGYEMTKGEKDLILQATVLVQEARAATKARKELKARLQATA